MCRNGLTLVRLVILKVVIPTIDTYTDIAFAVEASSNHYYGVASLMIAPPCFSFILTIYVWIRYDFDTTKEKCFKWFILLVQLWPQYQAAKLIMLIVRDEPENKWKLQKKNNKRKISNLNQFIEAIPQCFIRICIFTSLTFITDKNSLDIGKFGQFVDLWQIEDITKIFGPDTFGICNTIMFPLTIFISMIRGIMCVKDYLEDGPLNITSENRCCNYIVSTAKMIYVVTSFLLRVAQVMTLVFGSIMAIFFFQEWTSIELWTGKDKCLLYLMLLILFIDIIVIPSLFTILPLWRYLGIKRTFAMMMKYPGLLTLPFITDIVYGPINAYGYGRYCGNYYLIQYNFCCCFCGTNCSFISGSRIQISKRMSWLKILYTTIQLLLPIVIFMGYSGPFNNFISSKIGIVFVFIVAVLAINCITLTITLHGKRVFGVLDLDASEEMQDESRGNYELVNVPGNQNTASK